MRTCPRCGRALYTQESECWACLANEIEPWVAFPPPRPVRPFAYPSAPQLPESILAFARAAHPERYAWTRADDDAFNCAYADWLDMERQ